MDRKCSYVRLRDKVHDLKRTGPILTRTSVEIDPDLGDIEDGSIGPLESQSESTDLTCIPCSPSDLRCLRCRSVFSRYRSLMHWY
jgi:hypothetical protein